MFSLHALKVMLRNRDIRLIHVGGPTGAMRTSLTRQAGLTFLVYSDAISFFVTEFDSVSRCDDNTPLFGKRPLTLSLVPKGLGIADVGA